MHKHCFVATCLQDDCNCLSFCRTFPLSPLSLFYPVLLLFLLSGLPFQQYKIKTSYKAFAAIPTNTLLMEQKVSVCSKTWALHCTFETIQLCVQIRTCLLGNTAECEFWELATQDCNSRHFIGSSTFTEDQSSSNLNFRKSIYYKKGKKFHCPKGIAFYCSITKSGFFLESV